MWQSVKINVNLKIRKRIKIATFASKIYMIMISKKIKVRNMARKNKITKITKMKKDKLLPLTATTQVRSNTIMGA